MLFYLSFGVKAGGVRESDREKRVGVKVAVSCEFEFCCVVKRRKKCICVSCVFLCI